MSLVSGDERLAGAVLKVSDERGQRLTVAGTLSDLGMVGSVDVLDGSLNGRTVVALVVPLVRRNGSHRGNRGLYRGRGGHDSLDGSRDAGTVVERHLTARGAPLLGTTTLDRALEGHATGADDGNGLDGLVAHVSTMRLPAAEYKHFLSDACHTRIPCIPRPEGAY